MRHLWRAGRTFFAILVGVALALALASPAGAVIASTPAIAVQQGATRAQDTPAYVYDAPAQLSSSETAPKEARGSPSGPEATSWGGLSPSGLPVLPQTPQRTVGAAASAT